MALAIATIPVLTGEVAETFESQAQKTYKEYVDNTSPQQPTNTRYIQGVKLVRNILSKSKLGVL